MAQRATSSVALNSTFIAVVKTKSTVQMVANAALSEPDIDFADRILKFRRRTDRPAPGSWLTNPGRLADVLSCGLSRAFIFFYYHLSAF